MLDYADGVGDTTLRNQILDCPWNPCETEWSLVIAALKLACKCPKHRVLLRLKPAAYRGMPIPIASVTPCFELALEPRFIANH